MKAARPKLPAELSKFVDGGHTTFHCDDGDWELRIEAGADLEIADELPPRSTVIAENLCGDYLFLKKSAAGKFDPRVFVYWHEEDRHEQFAKHIKELTTAKPPKRDASAAKPAATKGAKRVIEPEDLLKALAAKDHKARIAALQKLKETAIGPKLLPVLAGALDDSDVQVVHLAAECIAALGKQLTGEEFEEGELDDYELPLTRAGSKVWSYSNYANCYSPCLEALVALRIDDEIIIDYVKMHIGLTCFDDILASLTALKTIGSRQSLDLLKRAAAFWMPELNMAQTKKVKAILASSGRSKK